MRSLVWLGFGGTLTNGEQQVALEAFVASLAQGHDDLGARLKFLTHSAKSKSERVHVHAHYLAFRDGKPTISEFVAILYTKLVPFCLTRKQINDAQIAWKELPSNKVQESAVALHHQALDLFIRANRNTNRNGEFGELITFLLIESVLKAPQLVAKISLKTSPQMPVHGSDGIHVRYDATGDELKLYWGESKCHASVNGAINAAAESIAKNLKDDKMEHEIFLVRQGLELAGFPQDFKDALLCFLNPYNDKYNSRSDVSVVFIAFDFEAFGQLEGIDPKQIESRFAEKLDAALPDYVERLDAALTSNSVQDHTIEAFFLPVPSIDSLRTQFQDRIGWTA